METRCLSNDEIMKMYVQANLDVLLPASLAMALEMQIAKMPLEQQNKLQEKIAFIKRFPQLFSRLYFMESKGAINQGNLLETFDRGSLSFEHMSGVCEKLMDYYEQNEEAIQEDFISIFADEGINLVIVDR